MVRTSLLAFVLLLPGCGFHLHDALLLPPDLGPVRIQADDADGPLAQQLQQALQRAGATIAAPGDADAAPLRILSERLCDASLSIDQRYEEHTTRLQSLMRITYYVF